MGLASMGLTAGQGRPLRASLWRWVLLAWLVLLAGCATPQLAGLQRERPSDVPATADLGQVPFFPQDEFQCGPAALAMVAQFAGVATTPGELKPQVFLPDRQGSLQIEMLATARRQGLVALTLEPQLHALLRQVAAGQPVVVLLNLSLPWVPMWHYAVVVGYDLPGQTIVLHSGRQERMAMSLPTFERTWARGRHWAMVALPPSQLPAQAQALPWLQSAAAMERVHPEAAGQAYATAVKAWPAEPAAWLGQGNAYYAQGHLAQAGEAFEAATRLAPDFADAWNNLAQVRAEQKRWAEAAQAIERAVAVGGPRLARYRELQQRIEEGMAVQASLKGRATPPPIPVSARP
jgi:hypothetical protein